MKNILIFILLAFALQCQAQIIRVNEADKNKVLLVWVGGGGERYAPSIWEVPAYASKFTKDFTIYTVSYPLNQNTDGYQHSGNDFPKNIIESKRAVKMARSLHPNAKIYGIGHRFGATLLALTVYCNQPMFQPNTYTDVSDKLDGIVLMSGVYDFALLDYRVMSRVGEKGEDNWMIKYNGANYPDAIISPVTWVSDNKTPVMLIVGEHAQDDFLQFAAMEKAIEEKSIKTEILIVPNSRHWGGNFFSKRTQKAIISFLEL